MDIKIDRIEYRQGMIENVPEASKLPLKIMKKAEIPDKILNLIHDGRLWELSGTYGTPEAGDPIQYHHLKIVYDTGESEIEFFNLAIAMFMTEDEEIRKIFKVLVLLK